MSITNLLEASGWEVTEEKDEEGFLIVRPKKDVENG